MAGDRTQPRVSVPRALDRRRATVLFADIVGFTKLCERVGVEHAYAIVTGCLKLLDGVARRQGGVVDKYLGDAMMAVFGVPAPLENPSAAAIDAALEMRRTVDAYNRQAESPLPLAIKVGINTGTVTAGALHGPVVREFHVMGDAVNVAARLKERAPEGSIYVGGPTVDEAGGGLQLTALEPLALKGKTVTVAAFALHDREDARPASRPEALVFTPLVGRRDELGLLRAALRDLDSGVGAVVTLQGEAGIGKTRLLYELAQSDEARRCTTVAVRVGASSIGAALANVLAGPASATLAQRVESALRSGPLLVTIDDAQDSGADDDPTPATLAAIAAARPVLFVVAGRDVADGVLARLRTEVQRSRVRQHHICLTALREGDASELVGHVRAAELLAETTRDLVLERAAGNPLQVIFGTLLAPALESERGLTSRGVERTSLTERRRATVLFADISGFTRLSERLEPADAYHAVTGCLRVLHEAAAKHGGNIDKYLGDAIMAVFGVPIAVEDAPRAAVNAAIEMRRRVRAYNEEAALATRLDVHIGIDTGLGIAGDVSGPLLREFALMGESVGRASALTSMAPNGRVFVGHETYLATRDRFDYQPVDSSDVKADYANVVAYELVSEQEQLHRQRIGRGQTLFPDLVGREDELAVLGGALDDVVAGRGCAVGVFGEPGVGKSRLLEEVRGRGAAAGVRWLEARSLAIGGPLRFHPFVDLLRSFAQIDAPDDPNALEKLAAATRAALDARTDELLPFLGTILGLVLPPELRVHVDSVKGDALDRLLLHSMRELLEALALMTPVVVFFEDLHWADLSSVELLASLLRVSSDARLGILFAARPGFAATAGFVAGAARDTLGARYGQIDLRPLERSTVRRLLADLFAHGELPRQLRERLETRTAGSPLFLEELLRTLVEQGALETVGDKLRATAGVETVTLPETVQEVILARVDRLEPRAKELLQVAAVIGRSFTARLLARVAPEPERVAEALATLLDAQFLVERHGEGQALFTVKHPMLQDVAYDAMLETRREELHRAVATAIEEQGDESDPARHGLLAYHFGRGHDLTRAEDYLLRAGDDAARAAASAEAVYFFEEASRLYFALHGESGDPRKRLALEKKLATAYFYRGRLVEAGEYFNRALARLRVDIPRGRGGLAVSLARSLLASLPPLYLPSLRRRGTASPQDLEVLELMLDRARAQTTGDPTRFVIDTLEALRYLSRLDPATVPGAGTLFASTAGLFSYSGLSFDLSERFLGLAERYVDYGDASEALVFRMMRFTHHFLVGNWQRSFEIDASLLEDGLRRGQLWDVATHLGLEGTKLTLQGRFAEAEERVARIATIEDRYTYDLASSNRHSVTVSLYLEQRRLADALLAADTYVVEHEEPLLNVISLGLKAKVQVLLGRTDDAAATLAAADTLMAKLGRIPPLHRGHCERSRLLLEVALLESPDRGTRAARLPKANRALARAVRCADRVAWLQPEVFRAAGTCCWHASHVRAAARWWARSLAVAARLETKAEHARTQAEIGRRLLAAGRLGDSIGGRSARQHLAEACRHFEGAGLDHDLATAGEV